jgi:hypothetical protein
MKHSIDKTKFALAAQLPNEIHGTFRICLIDTDDAVRGRNLLI